MPPPGCLFGFLCLGSGLGSCSGSSGRSSELKIALFLFMFCNRSCSYADVSASKPAGSCFCFSELSGVIFPACFLSSSISVSTRNAGKQGKEKAELILTLFTSAMAEPGANVHTIRYVYAGDSTDHVQGRTSGVYSGYYGTPRGSGAAGSSWMDGWTRVSVQCPQRPRSLLSERACCLPKAFEPHVYVLPLPDMIKGGRGSVFSTFPDLTHSNYYVGGAPVDCTCVPPTYSRSALSSLHFGVLGRPLGRCIRRPSPRPTRVLSVTRRGSGRSRAVVM